MTKRISGTDRETMTRMSVPEIAWVRLVLSNDTDLPPAPRLRAGLRITTLAELGDSETVRREVHALERECAAEVPGRVDFFTWEEYVEQRFDTPRFRAQGHVLAQDHDRLVGLCVLSQPPEQEWAFVEFTGVLDSHRRLALATAMKREAVVRARAWGADGIRTIHHPDSVPIIEANRTFGFVDVRD